MEIAHTHCNSIISQLTSDFTLCLRLTGNKYQPEFLVKDRFQVSIVAI